MSNNDIDKILYSAIRNKTHLKIRRKSYFRQALKLLYLVIFKYPDKPKLNQNYSTVLNDLPQKQYDFQGFKVNNIRLNYNYPEFKSLFFIEILLNIAFLVNIKLFQHFLFLISKIQVLKFISKYNVTALLCGHPTILMTFIAYYLNLHNKEVITVQHGVYSLTSYKVLWFEKNLATKIIVYSEMFKNLYNSQGINAGKIYIGTPDFKHNFKQNKTDILIVSENLKNSKIIFLGQQLYKISNQVFEVYNDFLARLIEYYKEKNIHLYYKPHPRENIQESLNSENIEKIVLFNNKDSLFENFDIFYSVNSSLLLEAYLQKKICYQAEIPISDLKYDFFNTHTTFL